MADLNNLTALEITEILPPSEPDLGPDDIAKARVSRIAFLDMEKLRLKDHAAVLEAWGGRIAVFPPPPQPQTLQQLVEAARSALRTSRLATDRLTLDRHLLLIDAVRAEVAR